MTLFAGLLNLGRLFYWMVFVYAFSANAFFLVCFQCFAVSLFDVWLQLRSLRHVVLPDPTSSPANVSVGNANTITPGQRRMRIQFLLFIAVTQFLYMLVLVRV